MTNSKSSLASTFARLRKSSGLSVRDLEEASGVARSVISRIENGKYLSPSASTLTRLAEGLRTDASELMSAAGYTAKRADALPSIRPYLRSKYGHLSADERNQLSDFLERLDAERQELRTAKPTTSKQRGSTKGTIKNEGRS